MIIGIDFDNVLADYNGAVKKLVEEIRGLPPGSLPEADSWGFVNWGLTDEHFILYHKLLCETDRNMQMEPIDSAIFHVNGLRREGHEIVIITQRANWPHFNAQMKEKIASETIRWLNKHAIPFDDICFVTDKTTINVDVLIDDGPHHIEAYQKAGYDVIIFDYPANRHLTGPRVKHWQEIGMELVHLRKKELLTKLQAEKKVPSWLNMD